MPKKQIDEMKPSREELTEAEAERAYKEFMDAYLIQKIITENWSAQQRWQSTHRGVSYQEGPLYQRIASKNIDKLYDSYRAGDKQALLEALYGCFIHSLSFPRWCKKAFISACEEVYTYKAKTWDDVFGRPHPKGTHLAAKREEREMSFRVYEEIRQIKKECPSTPIDGQLFEEVGKKFGIGGKTKTEEWYYKRKDEIDEG